MDQFHVEVYLEEWAAAPLAIKIWDPMNNDMLEGNRPGGRRKRRRRRRRGEGEESNNINDNNNNNNKHRASEGMFYIGGHGFVCQIIEAVTFARCALIFALRNIALDGYLDTCRNI